MKTAPVKELVEEVLGALSKPYGEDVIEDVFVQIESNRKWLRRYDELCEELSQKTVNARGGQWINQAVGGQALRVVPAMRTDLIRSYTKLEWRR